MHGQILDSVDNAQYLGVDIADDLNFSQHVNRITSNAMKSLGYLKRNVKPSHSGIREAAYKTIVWLQLEYASTVWSPYTKKDIYKVEMIQKRSILWILNSYSTYDSVTAMQLQLFLRSLEQRSADASIIMLYKIVHGLEAIPLPVYIEPLTRMTRHSHPLALRQIHTYANYYKYSFFSSISTCSLLEWVTSPHCHAAYTGPVQCGS